MMNSNFKRLIIVTTILTSGLATTMISAAIAQLPTPYPQSLAQADNSIVAIERSIHNRINQYRSRNGLPPLRLDDRISQMARAHSEVMARGRVAFGHQGFERRSKAIQKIVTSSDMAENVAYSGGLDRPAQQAVEVWLNSPSHRTNIEGKYNTTGIGVALSPNGRYYFTQIFVRSN
jgi:uncharacterized protein YkwD